MHEKSEVGSRKSELLDSDFRLPTSDLPPVLFVGDCWHEEFRPAVGELRQRCRLASAPDAAAALEALREAELPPALVVLAQSRPGEFGAGEIDRLRAAAPLARFVGLLGSWCEGELRSGSPWPCVIRLYWHQWLRLLPEIAALEAGRSSAWSLPSTATEEERLLWAASRAWPGQRGLAAIVSDDFATAQWLIDACRSRGLATVWTANSQLGAVQGAEFVLWDVVSPDDSQSELARLTAAFPQSKIIALANFPRLDDERHWRSAGVAAVLAKPFLLSDLFGQMRESP